MHRKFTVTEIFPLNFLRSGNLIEYIHTLVFELKPGKAIRFVMHFFLSLLDTERYSGQ